MDKELSLDLLESIASILDNETRQNFSLCSHTTRIATFRYPLGELKLNWRLGREILETRDPARILHHQRRVEIKLLPDDPPWSKDLSMLLQHCQRIGSIAFRILVAPSPSRTAAVAVQSDSAEPAVVDLGENCSVSPVVLDLPLISLNLHEEHSSVTAFLWINRQSGDTNHPWLFDDSLDCLLQVPCKDFRVIDAVLDASIYYKILSMGKAGHIGLHDCVLPEVDLQSWSPNLKEPKTPCVRSVHLQVPQVFWTDDGYVLNGTSGIWPFLMEAGHTLEMLRLNIIPAPLPAKQEKELLFPSLFEIGFPTGNFHEIVKWPAMPKLSRIFVYELCSYSQQGLEIIACNSPANVWFQILQVSTAVYPCALAALKDMDKAHQIDIRVTNLSISVRELEEDIRWILSDVRTLVITWEFDDEFDFRGKPFECERLFDLIVVVEEGAEGFQILADVIKPSRRLRDGMQVFFKKSRNCDWR